jgi:hypothetical protein
MPTLCYLDNYECFIQRKRPLDHGRLRADATCRRQAEHDRRFTYGKRWGRIYEKIDAGVLCTELSYIDRATRAICWV